MTCAPTNRLATRDFELYEGGTRERVLFMAPASWLFLRYFFRYFPGVYFLKVCVSRRNRRSDPFLSPVDPREEGEPLLVYLDRFVGGRSCFARETLPCCVFPLLLVLLFPLSCFFFVSVSFCLFVHLSF